MANRGMFASSRLLLVVAVVATIARAQTNCYKDNGLASRCEPALNNIAENRLPTATNTCGSPPSPFCFITGAVLADEDTCGVCNASEPSQSYGPAYMTDPNDYRNPTWWQSRTLTTPASITANITLSFDKTYEVRFVNIEFYSPRPKSFVIYSSNDFGRTYRPWQFYSSVCQTTFGRRNEAGKPLLDDQEAICTDDYSDIVPLSGATVPFSPMRNRRSGAELDTTPALQDWITSTNVRIVLTELNTFRDEAFGSPSAFQRYFYAIQDVAVGARCKCNGHAGACVVENGTLNCDCQHNTTGRDCDRCKPFYYDRPWRRATFDDANECIRCRCNDHADSCYFDQATYDATGSGGVCENCRDNTVGQHCDRCASEYYLPTNGDITKSDACRECRCKAAGTKNGQTTCAAGTGQCDCKSRAMGRKCNKCPDRFFNLTETNPKGCEPCNCVVAGTVDGNRVCDKVSGECNCKDNVFGRRCDACKDGFWALSDIDSLGCRPCNCGPGSQSAVCDKDSGQCPCVARASGRDCATIEPGYFAPWLDFYTLEAEDGSGVFDFESRVDGDGTEFTGRGYATIQVGESVTMTEFVPASNGEYRIYVRYSLDCKAGWNQLTATVTPTGENGTEAVTECQEIVVPTTLSAQLLATGVAQVRLLLPDACLRGGRSYSIRVTAADAGSPTCTELSIDSIIVVPVSPFGGRLAGFDADLVQRCVEARMSLTTASSAECNDVEATAMIDVAGIQNCDCDSDGSVTFFCDQFGGQCPCKTGFGGRRCDECRPGFYGDRCQRCDCDGKGSASGVCDFATGQCPCQPGVTGRRCDTCEANYFNFDSGTGCEDCSCNPIGSSGSQCDVVTGTCPCLPGVTGTRCDRCQGDYFQLTASGCLPCNCTEAGTSSLDCDSSGQCPCKNNVVGQLCDTCAVGAFNLKDANAAGCQPCFCYGHATSCSVAPGFVVTQITSTFNDDTYDGWTVVNGDGIDVTASVADYRKGKQAIRVRIDADNDDDIFFQAPAKFLGNLRHSYGYSLAVAMTFSSNVQEGRLIDAVGDVVLRSGRDGSRIGGRFKQRPSKSVSQYEVVLGIEGQWTNASSTPLSDADVVDFLENVDAVWIRASYPDLKGESVLLTSVDLRISRPGSSGSVADNVEQCACPPGYGGLSCDACLPGYTRSNPNDGRFSSCVPCPCNNHSLECDPDTTVCVGCGDNTAGDHCEACADGYYGNALGGTASDCALCPCPGTGANSFGATCALDGDGNVVCRNCSRGHVGRQCEACMDGYYGDPAGLRGSPTSCEDCECNGNIDPTATGNCDQETGDCQKCIYNTEGRACQKCTTGYFGNAEIRNNCTACTCDPDGVLPDVCHRRTGACLCKDHVTGDDCSRCDDAYYGFGSVDECRPCNCNPTGSETLQCDNGSGKCTCKPGVAGEKCDVCEPGFFGFSSSGCQACDCYTPGSASLVCNNATGQCECKSGAIGRQCNRCKIGKQDVSAGCIDCPDCFKQVNTTAEDLLALVNRLHNLLETIRETAVDTTDEAFTDALADLQVDVDDLLVNATALRKWYRDQLERLNNWRKEFNGVRRQIGRMKRTTTRAETTANDAETASVNTTAIVAEIESLLAGMQMRLDGEAKSLLDEARKKSDEQQGQLSELSDLRDKASRMASGHVVMAKNITNRAMQALDAAKNAVARAEKAVAEQRIVTNKIVAIMKDILNASKLASMTEAEKNKAVEAAGEALRNATRVLARSREPLIDFGTRKLLDDARYLVGNATQIVLELDAIDASNADLTRTINEANAESSELLRRGEEMAQTADEVLATLYVVDYEANKAVERGRMTTEDAYSLLGFLENFYVRVNETRVNVRGALDRVERGGDVLDTTDTFFAESLDLIDAASVDAAASVVAASDAATKSRVAVRNAETAQKAASDTLAKTEGWLDRARRLQADVSGTLGRVTEYGAKAKSEGDRIQAAMAKAKEALVESSQVGMNASLLLTEVSTFFSELEKNGSLPEDRFNATRRQLELTKGIFDDANPDGIIAELTKLKTDQENRIAEFQSKLVTIGVDLDHLRRINATVPGNVCYNVNDKTGD